jgi:hypothetical protein
VRLPEKSKWRAALRACGKSRCAAANVPVCFNTLFDLLLPHSDGFNFYETLWCAVLLVVALNKRTVSRETLNQQQNSVSLFASTEKICLLKMTLRVGACVAHTRVTDNEMSESNFDYACFIVSVIF